MIAGVSLARPQVMGILNVTPDSFSDGGDHVAVEVAVKSALRMQVEGAAFIDIGGESTRPGAAEVPIEVEIARVVPVIEGLRKVSDVAISIDTRKANVAEAAIKAGANFINDVSAFRFDPDLAEVVARTDVPVCLMHSVGTPETMQDQAQYRDVVQEVYDHLAERIAFAEAAGIARTQIVVDPGIGFGKTLEHNLDLLAGLDRFHALGCPVLLGASRKRFIGSIGGAENPKDRLGGSVAVALEGVRQGVQILRVHDTLATKQAIDLQLAMQGRGRDGQNSIRD